jgi:ribosomal protein L11 methylase PrmA
MARTPDLLPDPGSFRDPTNHVAIRGDEVFRCLNPAALADWDQFEKSRLFAETQADGRLVATERLANDEAASLGDYAGVLRHERLPLISYPYEWSFTMLKDAALLQLDLVAAALEEELITKDATPYNVQWRGAKPVFIDVGSFEPLRPGEYWFGYKQFCELFLYPLMLQAYKDVAFHAWLRGSIDGITPVEMRNLVSFRDRFRKGVTTHVVLHAKLQERNADHNREEKEAKAEKTSELHLELVKTRVKANVKKLRKLVEGLEWKSSKSTWSDYRADNSYSDSDARAKAEFVEQVATTASRGVVWDLGANDGAYSRIAAKNADLVLAVDADHLTVDQLYRQLRQDGETRITPLLLDLASPSPGIGWRSGERPPFVDRSKPDLILALALVHHLAIGRNVPLPEFLGWLLDCAPELVVEFPTRDDPQVKRLLRAKRAGIFDDYDLPQFESALTDRAKVVRRIELPSGTRVLYHVSRNGR